MIPTINRKVRVLVDWTVALFFKRDIVQLGSLSAMSVLITVGLLSAARSARGKLFGSIARLQDC